MTSFRDLGLHPDVMKGIDAAGYETCTPVQAEVYRHALQGRDVCVQSQTGTGKTAAFLVTVYELLASDRFRGGRRALVIAPTRELAVQIEEEARLLGQGLPYRTAAFYGGVGYGAQEESLRAGVDIMVGTPGRLLDLAEKRHFDFKDFGFLVIDEADRLFDMGFLPDVRRMLRKMQPAGKRQTMLLSATMNMETLSISREFMHEAEDVIVNPEQMTVEKITQELYHVGSHEKMSLLLGLLKRELPRSCLIFTNMKSTALRVSKALEHNGYKCQAIIGDLPQSKRLKIMEAFKEGHLPFMVATDVAARGLHIEDLELVVNYDLPVDPESYVHRIGRTARAGKTGKAITLACERFVLHLDSIEEFVGMKIPSVNPAEELFVADSSKGMDLVADRGRGHRRQDGGPETRRSRSGRGSGGDGQSARRSRSRTAPGEDKGQEKRRESASGQRSRRSELPRSAEGTGRPAGENQEGAAKRRRRPSRTSRGREKKASEVLVTTTTSHLGADMPVTADSREPVQAVRKEKRSESRTQGGGRPDRERRRRQEGGRKGGQDQSGPSGSEAERLAYYREKYGEQFVVRQSSDQGESGAHKREHKEKPSFFNKITRVFRKR